MAYNTSLTSTSGNGASARTSAASTTPRSASAAAKRPSTRTAARKRTATKSPRAATRSSARGGASSPRGHSTSTKRTTADVVGDYAERAVLIPVGAALMASETVTSSVNELISTYSSSRKVEAQLRRFQRRGGSARKRLEQVVRKRRTRVEREFRHRRRDLDRQRTRLTKDFSSQVELAQEQLEKTQTWLEDTLKSSMDGGQDLASRVQERVLSQV